MRAEEWENIAKCANRRVLEKSFNFDCEDNSIVGDLETREMAKMQAYRCELVLGVSLLYIGVLLSSFNDETDLRAELKNYKKMFLSGRARS